MAGLFVPVLYSLHVDVGYAAFMQDVHAFICTLIAEFDFMTPEQKALIPQPKGRESLGIVRAANLLCMPVKVIIIAITENFHQHD